SAGSKPAGAREKDAWPENPGRRLARVSPQFREFSQSCEIAGLEVVHQTPLKQTAELLADGLVRRMPEVQLQAGQIVEVDQNQEAGGGRRLLVQGSVRYTPADPNGPHGGNLQHRLLEGFDKRLAVARRQVGARFGDNDVTDHSRSVRRGFLGLPCLF